MKDKYSKTLSDYKEELHRCSKCGLCQAVCPLYKLTGNECSVSRGQFIMLNGVVKGDLKLNKNINKYLDLCLKCNKCSEFCPSEIDVVDILLCAKHQYFKNSLSGKIYAFLESKLVFNTFLRIIKTITRIFNSKYKSKQFDTKAVYFGGCISSLRPDVDNYVTKLLNSMDIERLDVEFDCCGMPFLTTGNINRFVAQIEENLSKLPDEFEYLITDCASCAWAWQNYYKYVDSDELKEKLSKIKFVSLYDLIEKNDLEFVAKKYTELSYHKPCHETSSDSIEKIISNIGNTNYVELDNKDSCCGFASLEHPQTIPVNLGIMKSKRETIIKNKACYILTSCVGCLINLRLLSLFTGKKTQRLLTFLKSKCVLEPPKS